MSYVNALQSIRKALNEIIEDYTTHIAEGRCENWEEYVRFSGSVAALRRVERMMEDKSEGANETDTG